MKIRTQNIAWTTVAGLFTLVAGSPVWADDTELLLVNPSISQQPKPNIMFILDTSGSMDSDVDTIVPYDSDNDYSGSCDRDRLYWTDVDVLPVCDGSETQFIQKTAYECISGDMRLGGLGSYTDTMVQYRQETIDFGGGFTVDIESWNDLEPGNSTAQVECMRDRKIHGDGTPGEVYATAYTHVAGSGSPWVSDPGIELSWGGAPRNIEYTVYDGNYLNWKENPVDVTLTRMEVVREVTKTVLNSITNVNVGVMRFNFNDGGPIIQAVVDLDTNRTSIVNAVDSLMEDGNTPLSEVLYEAALYWNGLPAEFGERISEHTTDPAALVSSDPEVYRAPILDACAKNYNVLLSDGLPREDNEGQALTPTLPDYTLLTGKTACRGTDQGDCLPDIAEYLSLKDTDPLSPGVQGVTTHTIGFANDIPILEDTADDSGGDYFLANDVESLAISLLSIVADITDRSLSFSAPAVSVNTFNRTQNLNDLYLTMFGAKTSVHWPGNLKKYKIVNRVITDSNNLSAVNPATGFFFDSSKSFWTAGAVPDGNDVLAGGAASLLPDPSVRNLYTNNGGSNVLASANNLITPSNAAAFTDADFGLSGATGEPAKDDLIRWMRGEDIRDEDNNPSTTVRNSMGDPLHSQPAALVYGGTPAAPEVVVYSATNDGYLHAIDGTTGIELWSFIPKELLSNMTRLYFDPKSNFKNYGLDGNVVPIVSDDNNNGIVDGADFVRLIVGMRRGGDNYYTLDVTDKNNPILMWSVSPSEGGQTWSTPVVAKVNAPGVNANKAVVIFGGGYDTVHDTGTHPAVQDNTGAAIVMLDLDTGAELWRASRNAGPGGLTLPSMTRAIPNQVRVIDISGDGFADRMYASDLGGQLLRFDIFNGQPVGSLVTGGVIAKLGAEGLGAPTLADTRRFYTSPDVSIFRSDRLDTRFLAISIGSGYRAHPLDNTNTDRFFSIRDPDVFNQLTQIEYNAYPVISDASLVEVGGQKQVVLDANDDGWMFTLPSNQKVLSDSITFDDEIFFVAFSPDSNAANTCSVGAGSNFLYRVSVVNGDPVVNNLDTLDPADADDARRQLLAQGGIAPTPTILFPSPDDPMCTGHDCAPPPIGCVGVECFDPGFANNPVRTLWSQDGIQ